MKAHYQDGVIEEIKLVSALRDRKIYFNEEVTRESVFKVLHLIDRIVNIDKKEGTKEDIEIILDCEGGTIYFGLMLVSRILELRKENYNINITVRSIAMSMGAIFLVCGSSRGAYKYATIMIHQPNSDAWGRLQDMEDDVEETNRLWGILKEIITTHTNITDKTLDRIKREKKDWFLSPEEALKLNIIDHII